MLAITQQPWVFLLNMIILGCEMGVPPFKETPIWNRWKKKDGGIDDSGHSAKVTSCQVWNIPRLKSVTVIKLVLVVKLHEGTRERMTLA